MTNNQCIQLQHAEDSSFSKIARGFGFRAVGPSARGSWLVLDTESQAWLFGRLTLARPNFGRTVVKSVWTDLNVSVMQGGGAK